MRLKITFFVFLIFFLLGVITLPQYGINWDTINHLPRGQAYLHYFLTGKKDYSDLENYKAYWQDPDKLGISADVPKSEVSSRSYYQNSAVTYSWYLAHDGEGHPPLSDIISAAFNRVLFGKLRIINDIDSYRVYGVFLAAVTVGLIFYWVSKYYGLFSGLIASMSLALYPLFWAESHFNTEKDIPITAYWTIFMYSVYKIVTQKSKRWVLIASLIFGLGLGTKFNILFAPLVIIPWTLIYLGKKTLGQMKRLVFSSVVILAIGMFIFFISWPYLWQDLYENTLGVFGFYKEIGTTVNIFEGFTLPFGFNSYALLWIIFTSPLVVLLLFLVGVFTTLKNWKKDTEKVSLFFLIWFVVPILRVSLPGSNIYGGVRQIMEYVPAMAALSGIGAGFLYEKVKSIGAKKLLAVLIITSYILFGPQLYKIHPFENVYFNSLAGGLSGAKEKDIPFWGNTFGGAYRSAVSWINKNAEEDSKLVYAYELMPNMPTIWVRRDIFFHNSQRSGFLKNGEYAMTLTYDGTAQRSYYDSYLEKFINPVYEGQVDSVSVVKVWKNDIEHTKPEYQKIEKVVGSKLKIDTNSVLIDLGKNYPLSYLVLEYSGECSLPSGATVSISNDGVTWIDKSERLLEGSVSYLDDNPFPGKMFYPFLADPIQKIRITYKGDSCLQKTKNAEVYYFSGK